jgi:integrase
VLGKRKTAIREGKFFDVHKETNIAFGPLCDRYLKEHAALHKKPRSYLRNEASTKVLKVFFGETTPAKQIQLADVSRFIVQRKGQGRSPYTINSEVAHLSHLFTWAGKLGLVVHHPVKGIGYLKVKPKERYLSREEIRLLLDACSGDLQDLIMLSLGTGMRATEVLTIDRDHTDLKRGVVTLVDTKNGDRRLVPLPSDVVAMLQQRPAPIREWFSGWNLYRLVHAMSRAIQHVGLKGVTFHTLRHTFASHAVMNGVDLFTVGKLLGHKTIQQTQRYAHLAPDHMRSAIEQTARALFAPEVPRHMPHETVAIV